MLKGRSSAIDIKATPKERQLIIDETAERLKDLVYWTAKKTAKNLLRKLGGIDTLLNDNSATELEFIFSYIMVAGDIQQIVARERRKNNGQKPD